jgi:hypothetical protein
VDPSLVPPGNFLIRISAGRWGHLVQNGIAFDSI